MTGLDKTLIILDESANRVWITKAEDPKNNFESLSYTTKNTLKVVLILQTNIVKELYKHFDAYRIGSKWYRCNKKLDSLIDF